MYAVPFLLDKGDQVWVGSRFPGTGEDDMVSYTYYRTKEKCEQESLGFLKGVREFLKPDKETHPDLDKYR
jgi:hypothetical protein